MKKRLHTFAHHISHTLTLSLAALREVFEESAYTRFLARYELESSPQAYADFLREQEVLKSCRHRCC